MFSLMSLNLTMMMTIPFQSNALLVWFHACVLFAYCTSYDDNVCTKNKYFTIVQFGKLNFSIPVSLLMVSHGAVECRSQCKFLLLNDIGSLAVLTRFESGFILG
jgi:hypothetical protein